MNWDTKTVVITGGATGIGYATAQLAIERGARAVILGRTEETLRTAQQSLGPSASYRVLDVTDAQAVQQAFTEIGPFDHLFAFAAITEGGRFADISEERMRTFVESKFWGQYHAVKAALRLLPPDGSITLMSGYLYRKPIAGYTPYAVANGAVEALTKALALEIAPVRINALSPGWIDTRADRTPPAEHDQYLKAASDAAPVARAGTARETAQAALFLAENPFMSGAVVDIDGGLS
ncbi:SDR family oxidoreductase [Promicromonospora sukumoe]|uniref:SDR family oxidoreductase n=1 Tax=Promicromonospora sukumoe TaxID=88382 RepID=UPI00365AECFA